MTITVSLPQRLEMDYIQGFCNNLDNSRNEPKVYIDFSLLNFTYPTSMLVVGSKLREWVNYRLEKGLGSFSRGINSENAVHSYLMHLGFFKFIHLDAGKDIGQARGNSRYLPITKIQRPQFDPFDQSISDWYHSIQHESERLAQVIANGNPDCLETYAYSIREIIRNVFEHSNANECFICGQRWWDGRVEIAIIDEGVGITSTLRESFEVNTDAEALEMAISPGVSRVNGIPQAQNFYENSGFGLYILNEIGSKHGWFTLGSGNTKLIKSETECLVDHLNFKGTFIGMQIFKPIQNFGDILSKIISRGEMESGERGIAKTASGASKLVKF